MAEKVGLSESRIQSMLWLNWQQQAEMMQNLRIRRLLISRDRNPTTYNETGTLLPPPFNETSLAIRTRIGETSKAVSIAASRITANAPDIAVIPMTAKGDLAATVDKTAGMQERLDEQLWYECGGPDNHWQAAWAKCVGAASFYLVLPRDADFGLPNRMYFDESDEEIQRLKDAGKLAPLKKKLPSGLFVYAEHGDVWAARRKAYSRSRAIAGRSLFTVSVYPRDMVLKERDREAKDLKWAAVIEEIAASDCAPGSDFAREMARSKGIPEDDVGLWGIIWDEKRKRIIGGISQGGPMGSESKSQTAYTLIRFFDREEQVIMIGPRNSVQGASEIWRGEHGCTVMGVPSCPVVEDPFYRTDINVPGKEYATALDPVFAYVPGINQLLTLESNVAGWNGIPRMVMESPNGTVRGEDGEPVNVESTPVPGLNPNEIAVYPGKVTQLVIDDKSLLEALKIYFERLDSVMPQMGGADSGADAAAWAIQQRIQESQQPYQKPVDNSCQAISGVIQRMHGWMRDLDVPIYFFAAPGHRKTQRDIRGLIEFDPRDLTDSIRVTQALDTPSEMTVRIQVGMELWQATLISDEEFAEKYLREQDAREWQINRWVQIITNYVMTGALPPVPPGTQPGPDPMVKIVADGVRGQVHYALIAQSDNYAWSVARQMAQQASQQAQQGAPGQMPPGGAPPPGQPGQPPPMQPPGGMGDAGQAVQPQTTGNVAQAAGIALPGMNMNPTLQGQLGASVPGGPQMSQIAGAQ